MSVSIHLTVYILNLRTIGLVVREKATNKFTFVFKIILVWKLGLGCQENGDISVKF